MLYLLAACIDVGLVKQDDRPGAFDTGNDVPSDTSTDTSADTTGDTQDTEGETAPDTSDDTSEPTTDTSVDTSGDTSSSEDTSEEPPAAIVVEGVCTGGYPYSGYADPAATEPELNVVGVYESQSGTGGPVSVTVTRTAEMVLVLTSYSSVDWQIDLDAAHDVTEVIVSSYDVSTWAFTGAGTAPVTYVGWIGECGYEIPDMDPHSGCETPDLQAAVERRTGLAMSSFQGCYAGGDYRVE